MTSQLKRKHETLEVSYSSGTKLGGQFTNGYLEKGKCVTNKFTAIGSFTVPQIIDEKAVITFENGKKLENNVTNLLCENEYGCGKLEKGILSVNKLDTYEGNFEDGILVNGKITSSDREISGTFTDGQLTKGSVLYSNDLQVEGTFSNGILTKGHICYPDGVKEEGVFNCAHLVNGTILHKDGYKAEGSFEKGQIIKGKVSYPDGYIEEGKFEYGRLITGKITYPDGVCEQGSFKYGKLV